MGAGRGGRQRASCLQGRGDALGVAGGGRGALRWTVKPGLQLRPAWPSLLLRTPAGQTPASPACAGHCPQGPPQRQIPIQASGRPAEAKHQGRDPAGSAWARRPPLWGWLVMAEAGPPWEVEACVGLASEVEGPPAHGAPTDSHPPSADAEAGVTLQDPRGLGGCGGGFLERPAEDRATDVTEELSPEHQAAACLGGPWRRREGSALMSVWEAGSRGAGWPRPGDQGPKPSESRKRNMAPTGGAGGRPL